MVVSEVVVIVDAGAEVTPHSSQDSGWYLSPALTPCRLFFSPTLSRLSFGYANSSSTAFPLLMYKVTLLQPPLLPFHAYSHDFRRKMCCRLGDDMPETDGNARNPDDTDSKTSDSNSGNTEECKNLKIADKVIEDEDPDRHLAKIAIQREVKNRVKLYVLCDQRVWDDKGTGHVACVPSPGHQGATFIVVRLEHSDKNILESRILMDTIYQKQQVSLK
uniref:Uncharacterized protein n=1 Tax=Setaria digitata TaxID=48799 RepID=A0A915PND4_9BILA